jgi:Fe-S cluster biogenesis protein NfuA
MKSPLARKGRPIKEIEIALRQEVAQLGSIINLSHCAIELHEYVAPDGHAILTIDGTCPDCDVSPATFTAGIETRLRLRVPELKTVSIVERK